MTPSKEQETHLGLAGVIAGDSAICLCGAVDESLLYRGYSIEDLSSQSSFEEVAWLLIYGELPSQVELKQFKSTLSAYRALSPEMQDLLEKIPFSTHPMDMLRTAVSFFDHRLSSDRMKASQLADQLLAALPSLLLYWWHFHQSKIRIKTDIEASSIAEHFLKLLYGKEPSSQQVKALDVALILYAEHEFNASTFTVRIIASTLSTYCSAITGGIGALRGHLHGGANEWTMKYLEGITSPEEAEKLVLSSLQQKQLVMGFGHRVYKKTDPRSVIIKEWARKLTQEVGKQQLFVIAERIEQVMYREKKLYPNLDFYSAVAFECLDIPIGLFTPIFVMSRLTGWTAHFIEQQANNKLIRPLSYYTGPAQHSYVPLDQRS